MHIIAIDGGYQEVCIDDKYPSNTLCYYSAGALAFVVNDLEKIEEQRTINPDDLSRLKNIGRFNFVVPMQNIRLKEYDFKTTIRKTIFEIFKNNKLRYQ